MTMRAPRRRASDGPTDRLAAMLGLLEDPNWGHEALTRKVAALLRDADERAGAMKTIRFIFAIFTVLAAIVVVLGAFHTGVL